MKTRITSTLIALFMAISGLVGAAAPAGAAGEHCSQYVSPLSALTYHYPMQVVYRHCGDGQSPEHYYWRIDQIRFPNNQLGVSGDWSGMTAYGSVYNGAGTQVDHAQNISNTSAIWLEMGHIKVTSPEVRYTAVDHYYSTPDRPQVGTPWSP